MLAAALAGAFLAVCVHLRGNVLVLAGNGIEDGIALGLHGLVGFCVHIGGNTAEVHTHEGTVNDEVVSFGIGINHGQLVRGGVGDFAFALDDLSGDLEGLGLFERSFEVLGAGAQGQCHKGDANK